FIVESPIRTLQRILALQLLFALQVQRRWLFPLTPEGADRASVQRPWWRRALKCSIALLIACVVQVLALGIGFSLLSLLELALSSAGLGTAAALLNPGARFALTFLALVASDLFFLNRFDAVASEYPLFNRTLRLRIALVRGLVRVFNSCVLLGLSLLP